MAEDSQQPPPSQPPTTPPSPPPSPPAEGADRRKLVEAYHDLVRSERDRQVAMPTGERAPSLPIRSLALLVLAAMLALILLLQPAWMFLPRRLSEPAEVQDASLRLRMFRAIEMINGYRHGHGSLPETLPEAGIDSLGLRYLPNNSDYVLTGSNGALTLTYTSSEDPRQFLGSSYDLISRRRARP